MLCDYQAMNDTCIHQQNTLQYHRLLAYWIDKYTQSIRDTRQLTVRKDTVTELIRAKLFTRFCAEIH